MSMSGFVQPGVTLTGSELDLRQRPGLKATPVFIGYTEKGNQGVCKPIHSWREFTFEFGQTITDGHLYNSLQAYFNNDGFGCFVISLGAAADKSTVADYETALRQLEDEPLINLIVMPDMVSLPVLQWKTLVTQVGSLCVESLNLFALIDFPYDPDAAKTLCDGDAWRGEDRMAGYWPWVFCDTGPSTALLEERLTPIPPAGMVAAVIQQADSTHGVWRAPAGVVLKQVVKPAFSHQAVSLFSADPRGGRSVNQIRSFSGRGVMVWGCRTLTRSGNRLNLYVQNRRLINWILATLNQALQPFVFEPNNEISWYRIKSLVRRYLRELREQGAFLGETEDQAYQIGVGVGESMTVDDLNAGLLRIQVGVALHRPAEFIHINLCLTMNDPQTAGANGMLTGDMML